jgi:SAM-dependent methyltransferase
VDRRIFFGGLVVRVRIMQVTLHDGSQQDLTALDPQQLAQLHWEQERAFAQRIREAPRGSPARAEAFRQGYDTVTAILGRRFGSHDGLQMGHNPRYARLVLRLLRRIVRRGSTAGSSPAGRFFEIGYGCGAMLQAVAAAGHGVAGIEVSTHMQQQARQRLPAGKDAGLLLGDFLTHPLEGPHVRYDLVYWNDVFEHLPVDEAPDYLRRIHQLLVPGGALVTITPNWHARPGDVTWDHKPPRSEAEGFHLKEYTLREMTRLLRAAGFRRVATPWLVTRRHTVLLGSGWRSIKCLCEPALEWLPFGLAHLLVRGMGLNTTIAWK